MKTKDRFTTAVNFYRAVDVDSVMWRKLRDLATRFDNIYWIGGNMGVAVENVTWHEAMTVATQIAYTILKSDAASVFREMKITMTPYQEQSPWPPRFRALGYGE